MGTTQSRVVIPGDVVEVEGDNDDAKQRVIVGPGLRRGEEGGGHILISTKCGILRKSTQNPPMYWIDSHGKRYVATRGENVIGTVIGKSMDYFRVDIGCSQPALLSYLAFEGATKKNRPNVKVGDLVYAKLLVASRDMEPELVCVDSYGKKAGLGVLSDGGLMLTVPLHVIRKLLGSNSVLLSALGQTIPFEIAIGMNGRVWIRAKTVKEIICLANAIQVAEHMNDDEIKMMCSKLSDTLPGFTSDLIVISLINELI